MKYSRKRLIIAATLGSLALGIAIGPAVVRSKKKNQAPLNKKLVSEEMERQQHNVTGATAQAITQISLKDKTREEAMQIWWERRERDKQADWKVPIRFYGKVVDQDARPISGVNVEFEWTDVSPHGVSKQNTTSDENGFFSLTGIHGKNLGVRISKEGYLAGKDVRSRDFEFADPGEADYYEPNPDNPVLFQLRKKGQGAELLKKSVEVVLPGDGSSKHVELTSGKAQPSGQLQVQSWKPWPPRPMSPHYDWKIALIIPDGGFVEAHEEFAFEAPETVYEPTFEINMPANLGNAWKVSAEKMLYFAYGNPKKYGRLNLRTDGNSRYIFIDYVLNPSGSRDLEASSTPTKTSP